MFRRAASTLSIISICLLAPQPLQSATNIPPGTTIGTDTTWALTGSPFVVASGGVFVQLGVTLTIEPGVVVKFQTATGLAFIVVNGKLIADGSPTQKIVFTSLLDDALDAGGDTNGDGSATTPSSVDWSGLIFHAGATGSISNATLRYGGGSLGALTVETGSSSPTVTNNSVTDSNIGLWITDTGTSPTIRGNTITRNATGVQVVSGAAPHINFNNILNNSAIGVNNGDCPTNIACSTTPDVDASNNYWGNANGPSRDPDRVGFGDKISFHVNFIPFQTQPGPQIIVSPYPVVFPPTPLNTRSAPVTVTVLNSGTATLAISNIATQDPFAILGPLPPSVLSIPAGTQASFDMVFTPTGPGPFSGTLTIDSNDSTVPILNIPLQGTGFIPAPPSPPSVTSVSPSSGFQGQVIADFTVNGNNFDLAATLSFGGFGITVNSYSSRTPTQMVAQIIIDRPTLPGARDVRVVNPDLQAFTLKGGFMVTTGFLLFPLRGTHPGVDEQLGPYTAPINSVFDHLMKDKNGNFGIYKCDDAVQAYTGELGNLDPSGNAFKIGCKQGYAQDALQTAIYGNGHYLGGGDVTRLYYDGHPGFDYRARFGTEVYATVKGVVHYPTQVQLQVQNLTIGGNPDVFNVLELDPSNDYKIFYLHLSTHPRTISIHLTADTTGQDFVASPAGTPVTSAVGTLTKAAPLSITGQVTLSGKPLPRVQIELLGLTETGKCASAQATTDAKGTYRFSSLLAGFYHIRPFLAGYSFVPLNPSLVVQDGASVTAGALVGFSGNAGPCLSPHLHFEVQQKVSDAVASTTSLAFIPVDAYGWDGNQDPYETVPGVTNHNLWGFKPVVDNISPQLATAGAVDLTIKGKGFNANTAVCLIRKASVYSNPACITGVLKNQTDTQILVQMNLVAGTYFVHAETGDGHRSNWKKLIVQ